GEIYLTSNSPWYVGSEISTGPAAASITVASLQEVTVTIEVLANGDINLFKNNVKQVSVGGNEIDLAEFRSKSGYSLYIGTQSGASTIKNIVHVCQGANCDAESVSLESTVVATSVESTSVEMTSVDSTSVEITSIESNSVITTSDELTSAESSIDGVCSKSIGDYTANSNTAIANYVQYDPSNVISIPCSSGAFTLTFSADNTHDLFFILSNTPNAQSPVSIVGEIYLTSNSPWYVGSEISTGPAAASITVASLQEVTVTIEVLANGDINLFKNNVKQVSVGGNEIDLAEFRSRSGYSLYIGTQSGTSTIKNIVHVCQGAICDAESSYDETSYLSSTVVSINIPDMKIDSSSSPKNYGNNFVKIPCNVGSDFTVSFDVTTKCDIFVAFADQLGFISGNLILESGIGLMTGKSVFRTGRYSVKSKREFIKRQSTFIDASISYNYSNGTINAYKNNRFVLSSPTYGINFDKIYFAPLTNVATISGGSLTCN
ncbi:hypothetical protein AYI70_g10117, partial [Smittium culicis]